MHTMQTRPDCFAPNLNWLDPFGSWEAAARWNAMTAEWMASGWRQWLELVTLWPALEPAKAASVVPAQAGTQEARTVRGQATPSTRPTARSATKRPSAPRPARPQAAARPTRSRG